MARFTRKARTHPVTSLMCALAVIGSALAGALLTHAQVASASISQCASGEFCVWDGTGETGTFWEFTGPINSWAALTDPPGNVISSAYNDRSNVTHIGECTFQECADPPPAGAKDCMIGGGRRDNLGNFTFPNGTNENNNVGYIDLGGSAATC